MAVVVNAGASRGKRGVVSGSSGGEVCNISVSKILRRAMLLTLATSPSLGSATTLDGRVCPWRDSGGDHFSNCTKLPSSMRCTNCDGIHLLFEGEATGDPAYFFKPGSHCLGDEIVSAIDLDGYLGAPKVLEREVILTDYTSRWHRKRLGCLSEYIVNEGNGVGGADVSEIVKVLVLDFLIGSSDRHYQNVLRGVGGKVIPVDHDSIFGTKLDLKGFFNSCESLSCVRKFLSDSMLSSYSEQLLQLGFETEGLEGIIPDNLKRWVNSLDVKKQLAHLDVGSEKLLSLRFCEIVLKSCVNNFFSMKSLVSFF